MSVRRHGDVIHLEGICPVEDAEALLAALLEGVAKVDCSNLSRLHTAVAQILALARPRLVGLPADPWLRNRVLPAIFGPEQSHIEMSPGNL